jgi:sulfur-carrier protein
MISLKFYGPLRFFLSQKEIILSTKAAVLKDVLAEASDQLNKDLLGEIIADDTILPGTMILLNGRNVHHLNKLQTEVKDNDEISIFPPGGGG